MEDRHGIEPDEATKALDAEPSQSDLLGYLGKALGVDMGDGWAEIENAGAALQKQRADSVAAMKAEANIFRDTFDTPAGLKCLAIMRQMTIDAAPYPYDANLPLEAITPIMLVHDAQCRFVRQIVHAIDFANNRTPT